MIKLFAILTALAVLPVSALAGQNVETPNIAKNCGADKVDSPYAQAPTITSVAKQTDDATIAR